MLLGASDPATRLRLRRRRREGPYDPTTVTSMKTSLKNRLPILLNVFAIIPIRLLLKRREFWLQLKRGDRARVQTEMVEKSSFRSRSHANLKFVKFTS